MTVLGFTGARMATPAQAAYVRRHIATLEADTYVTGACTGVDEVIARAVTALWPDARNLIVVPFQRGVISPGFLDAMVAYPNVELMFMPRGTTYADRNQKIVDLSDRVIGFPPFPEDHPACVQSGTWQTLRMAYKKGLPREAWILTEEVPTA